MNLFGLLGGDELETHLLGGSGNSNEGSRAETQRTQS
jgi:hypothetical protein